MTFNIQAVVTLNQDPVADAAKKICTVCKGRKQVETPDSEYGVTPPFMDCPNCNGSGKVSDL